jgi:hypothetical protein
VRTPAHSPALILLAATLLAIRTDDKIRAQIVEHLASAHQEEIIAAVLRRVA